MINLFSVANNDQSLCYLYTIFGSMNGVIVPSDHCPANTGSVLGIMFQVFNSVVLALGVLVILYVSIVGVMMTAHEGEFMGKNWNKLWVPIRMVLGIGLLVPTSSGFSGIQIVMMWFILQGIAAGDVVWTKALDWISVTGSPFAKPTVPSVGASQALTGLFQAIVCDTAARYKPDQTSSTSSSSNSNYYCGQNPSASFCQTTPVTALTTSSTSFGPSGSCGSINTCDPVAACAGTASTSLACVACTASFKSINLILQQLFIPVATTFVMSDYDYRDFYANSYNSTKANWQYIYSYCNGQSSPIPLKQCCIPVSGSDVPNQICQAPSGSSNSSTNSGSTNPSFGNSSFGGYTPSNGNSSGTGGNANFPPPNADQMPQDANDTLIQNIIWPYAYPSMAGQGGLVATSLNQYETDLSGAIQTWIAAQSVTNPLTGDLAEASSDGWIFAGAYYYEIASMNNNNLAAAIPTLSYVPPNPDVNNTDNIMYGYRNNFSAAQTLINAGNGSSGTFVGAQPVSGVGTALSSGITDMSSGFQSNLNTTNTNTNPLAQLQSTGKTYLIVAEVLFAVLVVLAFALGLAGNLGDIFALGFGMLNPIGPAVAVVSLYLVPAAFGLLAILVAYGGLLAIYAPLIPYVLFATGAIGWMISVIEAMVAGPLVALGVLSPSGQHELLGKSEHAIMLLFNIFLRPSLMVFGMMSAMLLASVASGMISFGFNKAQTATGYIGTTDPLGAILFFGAWVSFQIAALNKCFSLIYVLPNQVITWIGGSHAAGREGPEGAEAMKAGVEKTGQQAGGAMGGSQSGAEKAGDETKMGKANYDAKKKGTKVTIKRRL